MNILRHLPAIHQLKNHPTFRQLLRREKMSEKKLTEQLQQAVKQVRHQLLNDQLQIDGTLDREQLTHIIFKQLDQLLKTFHTNKLRPVINATGVVLHTNLGRTRLSEQAIEQIVETAKTYSTLEYDLATNERGSRHDIVESYLTELTGAEAAIVVNNNAAAVYLVLSALAKQKEVIVSRGELVEIGGSFRISEIMAESGARLVDVGTTNKTKVTDYEWAVTEETALLMKVHKSNFALVGFAEEVTTDELIPLGDKYNIPIYEDLGSGTLYDFKRHNIGKEPTVLEKVEQGIDLISFSGDKLLGGPQAGIIVGKKQYIDRLKKHQLARVLRVDKMTLAGLEATLKSYLRGRATKEIPTLMDILQDATDIQQKAKSFLMTVNELTNHFALAMEEDVSKVGGGTMPEVNLQTFVITAKHKHLTSVQLAKRLRENILPIIVRVKDEHIVLDFRTVSEDELQTIIQTFVEIDHQDIRKE